MSSAVSCAVAALVASWALWPTDEVASLEQEQARIEAQMAGLPVKQPFEPPTAVGFHSSWVMSETSPVSVTLDLGAVFPLDEVYIVPAFPTSGRAYGFPARYRVEIASERAFQSPTMLLDRSGEDHSAPDGPIRIQAGGHSGRWIRFTATKLYRQPNWDQGYMFCLGEILAYSGWRNVALRREVDPSTSNRVNIPTWTPENLVDGITGLGLPVKPDSKPVEELKSGWHSMESLNANTEKWVQVDLGKEFEIEEIQAVPTNPATFTNRPGFGFPVRFKIELSNTPDFESPLMVVDQRDADFPNPGDNLVSWPISRLSARYVRFTATRLFERWNDYVFSLAELGVYSKGRNVALGARVISPEPTPNPMFSPEFLVDGRSSSGELLNQYDWLNLLAKRVDLEVALESLQGRLAMARTRANERWITLGWVAGVVTLVGGMGLFFRFRHQRAKSLQELRGQIARDLHDDIGSSLGSIALLSEFGKRDGDVDSFEEINQLAVEATESMRAILWMIRDGEPPSLEGLEKMLRLHCEQAIRGMEHGFETEVRAPASKLSLPFCRSFFLFFKEAIRNAVHHSGASLVSIKLQAEPRVVSLCIEDNGCGFDVDSRFAGSGIANMRHRAKALNGQLEIDSKSGKGTRIKLVVSLS